MRARRRRRRLRRIERDALASREIGERLFAERVHLGFLSLTSVMSMASSATRARPAAFCRSSSTMSCRRLSVSPLPPMLRDHAGRHLVHLGHGLVHAHVGDGAAQSLDLRRARWLTATSRALTRFL